jgi:[acyl-carrier-protein] S-malonyltransferase
MSKIALVFPGQGEQRPGMGKALFEDFVEAREVFQQADDILERNLSKRMFSGSQDELTQTKNGQPAIFVHSVAALRVLKKHLAGLPCVATAGHSLGEYAALVASEVLPFEKAISLVQARANCMAKACTMQKGAMAAILGLADEAFAELIKEINLPQDLWAANFNSPGQIVVSGTEKGIQKAVELAKVKGAKRAIPLKVEGAFHSGLMQPAEEQYAHFVKEVELQEPKTHLVMNVTGKGEKNVDRIRENMIRQITSPVLWTTCVEAVQESVPDLYIEVGPGQTLSSLHKRIVKGIGIKKFGAPEDLEQVLSVIS